MRRALILLAAALVLGAWIGMRGGGGGSGGCNSGQLAFSGSCASGQIATVGF